METSLLIRPYCLASAFFWQGNVYVQDGIDSSTLRIVYDKSAPGNDGTGAVDPQMSPDGRLVAFVKDGEIFVCSGRDPTPLGCDSLHRTRYLPLLPESGAGMHPHPVER